MNKAMESRALGTQVKEALKASRQCVIEIHSPVGNSAGRRLHKTLSVAGVKANLIEVVSKPNIGILIETSQECAGIGLAIQTAFGVAGIEAHLLVQNTRDPRTVVIHMGSAEKPSKAPK